MGQHIVVSFFDVRKQFSPGIHLFHQAISSFPPIFPTPSFPFLFGLQIPPVLCVCKHREGDLGVLHAFPKLHSEMNTETPSPILNPSKYKTCRDQQGQEEKARHDGRGY